MINCRMFVEFLMDYLAGTLPEPQREEFEGHLNECSACVTYLATYRETIRLGKDALCDPDAPLPKSIPEELVQAILDARRTAQSPLDPPDAGSDDKGSK